jgi:S1-C subfamily serine protease
MGIVPAFGEDGNGLGVQAVQSGKAAEKAGMLKDDIIIKIGDFEVKNIQDYMKAMKTFSTGQKTTVVVKRGIDVITLNVQF